MVPHQMERRACYRAGKCPRAAAGPGGKLLKCSRCKLVDFCSPDCQKAAWACHKHVCIAPVPAPPPLHRARVDPGGPATNLLLILHGLGDTYVGRCRCIATH